MTYFYLENFLDMVCDDYLPNHNLVEVYLHIYSQNLEFSTDSPNNVVENINEWYSIDPDTYSDQDVTDVNPFYMMKILIDEYGCDVFEGLNQDQIEAMCSHNYVRVEIFKEAEDFKEEVEEYLKENP